MSRNPLDEMLAGFQKSLDPGSEREVKQVAEQEDEAVDAPSERSLKRQAKRLVQPAATGRKDKITSLSFTEDFHWELKDYAHKRRTSMVAVIETAVREFMKRNPAE